MDKKDETNIFISDYLKDTSRHIGLIFPYMIKNKRDTNNIKISKHLESTRKSRKRFTKYVTSRVRFIK